MTHLNEPQGALLENAKIPTGTGEASRKAQLFTRRHAGRRLRPAFDGVDRFASVLLRKLAWVRLSLGEALSASGCRRGEDRFAPGAWDTNRLASSLACEGRAGLLFCWT